MLPGQAKRSTGKMETPAETGSRGGSGRGNTDETVPYPYPSPEPWVPKRGDHAVVTGGTHAGCFCTIVKVNRQKHSVVLDGGVVTVVDKTHLSPTGGEEADSGSSPIRCRRIFG